MIAIENDDCKLWPLSRVRARLNSYRVPIGTSVRMTFTRRVPRRKAMHSGAQDGPFQSECADTEQEIKIDQFHFQNSMDPEVLSISSCSDSSVQDGNLTPKASPRQKHIAVLKPPPEPAVQIHTSNDFTQSDSEVLKSVPSDVDKSNLESCAWASSIGESSTREGVLGDSIFRDCVSVHEVDHDIFFFDDVDVLIEGLSLDGDTGDYQYTENISPASLRLRYRYNSIT